MNTKHQKEFTELVEPHLPSLYSTAKRMTQDQYDAEDLVQETLFKAYRALDKYKKNTNFRAWIFRILINTYITHYRKTINQPQKVSFDDLEEFYLYKRLDEALFTYNTTKEDFLENLFEDEIKDALEDLPQQFRLPVLLCDVEDFTYDEIAKITEAPLGTVMSRLYRGRKLLQKSLWEYAKEHAYISDDVEENELV